MNYYSFYRKTFLIPDDPVIPEDDMYSVSRKTISVPSGEIEALGWPDENYPNSADGKWIIEGNALTYSQVELKFLTFDVEDG